MINQVQNYSRIVSFKIFIFIREGIIPVGMSDQAEIDEEGTNLDANEKTSKSVIFFSIKFYAINIKQ